jgi:hypothetical protein
MTKLENMPGPGSPCSAGLYGPQERVSRPWCDYPIGTLAHWVHGGYWIKAERGWKWCTGDTFPTPGDAFHVSVPLPV